MTEQRRRRLCFPLRLSPSLRAQASSLAEREGISLNHFISLAIAEKVIRMEMGNGHLNSNPHEEVIRKSNIAERYSG
jgi:hypothetical protein